MKVNYSDEKVLKGGKSIFLAGPTPRNVDVETWRKEAIKELESLGFDGIVYVPEKEFDDRTFNYDNQVWWEREALFNSDVVVFWIPRSLPDMPAFTTNVEYGYWIAKNSDKVIYGRPDESEKNRYLDWLYQTETGKEPINNLTGLLKGAITMTDEKGNNKDVDSYELNIIKKIIKKYPEIFGLVGEVQFTPESFGTQSSSATYGRMFFPNAGDDQLKEFDRTILSVVLYHYIKDNKYDKFVESQAEQTKLSKESFDELRQFMLTNFDTPEKEDLLLYYVVINDLGKSQRMIDAIKGNGIETVDHDLVLKYLLQFDMLPSMKIFSLEHQRSLLNVLDNGVNFGQFIQGECVDYSFNQLQNLSTFERNLMSTEAILDIAGVLGHVNQKGSVILNQPTADNFIIGSKVISDSNDVSTIFSTFIESKAKILGINIQDESIRKTITRICLMMRLSNPEDIKTVASEVMDNLEQYTTLIHEFNQTGYNGQSAILLYYSPATLSNANGYYKKQGVANPVEISLKACLPFMQNTMQQTRENIKTQGNGVITVMLRDAALVASEDPSQLNELTYDVLNNNEAAVQKKIK